MIYIMYICITIRNKPLKLNIMTTLKNNFETITEVQEEKARLESIHGSENVTMNLDRDSSYFYASFNIFN